MKPGYMAPTWGQACQRCAFVKRHIGYCRVPMRVGIFICDDCADELAQLVREWMDFGRAEARKRMAGANDLD